MQKYFSILYKADQRIAKVSGKNKHFSSFQKAFGNLHYLNDVFLSPGQEVFYKGDDFLYHILLPIVGTLCYNDSNTKDNLLSVDRILFLTSEHENYAVKNPFENQTINYLHIGLEKTKPELNGALTVPAALKNYNSSVSLNLEMLEPDYYGALAIYQGRTKGRYILKNASNSIVVYVINGAFEVEERLMEHRDGLALWDTPEIEFEAMSEFAILLILEIPLK